MCAYYLPDPEQMGEYLHTWNAMCRYLITVNDFFRGDERHDSLYSFCIECCTDDSGVINLQQVVEMFYVMHAVADFELHCIMREIASISI